MIFSFDVAEAAGYGGRVLSDAQIGEFAERGYIVVRQVVPGHIPDQAARRADDVAAADPPAAGTRGAYFIFSRPRTSRL